MPRKPPDAPETIPLSAARQTCLAAALGYLRRGWPCLPLCPGDHSLVPRGHRCEEKRHGKAPLVKWQPFQERLPTEEEVHGWWEQWPYANVGVALGERVSGLMAIDIDGPEGWDLLLQMLGEEPPATLEFATPGGGRRLFYRWPKDTPMPHCHKKTGGRALSFLGQGMYTVMPPSIHRTGGQYRWPESGGPEEVPIAAPSGAMLSALKPGRRPPERNSGGGARSANSNHGADWRVRASAYCAACAPAIQGQGGNRQTFDVACGLARSLGLTAEQILEALRSFYNPRCQPPWTDADLEAKANEAYKRHGGGLPISRPISRVAPVGEQTSRARRSRRASSYSQQSLQWFMHPYVPRGMLTLVVGMPGTGKSSFAAHLLGQAQNALFLPGWEEAFEIMTLPRLATNGVDLDRVHVLDRGDWKLPQSRDRLIEEANDVGADLILFDPISSYLADGGSENDGQFVRLALEAAVDVAIKTHAAVVGVRHPGKHAGNLMVGSREWRALPRSIVELLFDPGPPITRLIRLYKDSLGQNPPPRRYDLVGQPGKPRKFALCETCSQAQAELACEVPDRHKRSQVERAREMLELVLKGGEVEAKDVFALAEKERLKEWAVYQAAGLIGVERRREGLGMSQRCYWFLPEQAATPVTTP